MCIGQKKVQQNNHSYVEKVYGKKNLDKSTPLNKSDIVTLFNETNKSEFSLVIQSDHLNGPFVLMYAKRKIVFAIRLDNSLKTPKCI